MKPYCLGGRLARELSERANVLIKLRRLGIARTFHRVFPNTPIVYIGCSQEIHTKSAALYSHFPALFQGVIPKQWLVCGIALCFSAPRTSFQYSIKIHIVENLLLNEPVLDDILLIEPQCDFFFCFGDRSGRMHEIANRTIIIVCHFV